MIAMDAVCMALLAAAASVWEGTSREEHVSTAVIALELYTLIGEFELSSFCIMVTSSRRTTYHICFQSSKVTCRESCGFQLLLVIR